jgi:hypothetical protein
MGSDRWRESHPEDVERVSTRAIMAALYPFNVAFYCQLANLCI